MTTGSISWDRWPRRSSRCHPSTPWPTGASNASGWTNLTHERALRESVNLARSVHTPTTLAGPSAAVWKLLPPPVAAPAFALALKFPSARSSHIIARPSVPDVARSCPNSGWPPERELTPLRWTFHSDPSVEDVHSEFSSRSHIKSLSFQLFKKCTDPFYWATKGVTNPGSINIYTGIRSASVETATDGVDLLQRQPLYFVINIEATGKAHDELFYLFVV